MRIRVTFSPVDVEVDESVIDEYLLESYEAGEVSAASPEMKVAMLLDTDLDEFVYNWVESPDFSTIELVK